MVVWQANMRTCHWQGKFGCLASDHCADSALQSSHRLGVHVLKNINICDLAWWLFADMHVHVADNYGTDSWMQLPVQDVFLYSLSRQMTNTCATFPSRQFRSKASTNKVLQHPHWVGLHACMSSWLLLTVSVQHMRCTYAGFEKKRRSITRFCPEQARWWCRCQKLEGMWKHASQLKVFLGAHLSSFDVPWYKTSLADWTYPSRVNYYQRLSAALWNCDSWAAKSVLMSWRFDSASHLPHAQLIKKDCDIKHKPRSIHVYVQGLEQGCDSQCA